MTLSSHFSTYYDFFIILFDFFINFLNLLFYDVFTTFFDTLYTMTYFDILYYDFFLFLNFFFISFAIKQTVQSTFQRHNTGINVLGNQSMDFSITLISTHSSQGRATILQQHKEETNVNNLKQKQKHTYTYTYTYIYIHTHTYR